MKQAKKIEVRFRESASFTVAPQQGIPCVEPELDIELLG
jgi:hypothetical protein